MGTAPTVFPPSPGLGMNGWPQGTTARAGAASSGEGLAQLPPRFASAVSLSDGGAPRLILMQTYSDDKCR